LARTRPGRFLLRGECRRVRRKREGASPLGDPAVPRQALDERVEALRREIHRRADLFTGRARTKRGAPVRCGEGALDTRRERLEACARAEGVAERRRPPILKQLACGAVTFALVETASRSGFVGRAWDVESGE